MRKAIIIFVLVLFSFLFSAVFLKAISNEDCWMPDGKGGWVKHGIPAEPPPDYPSEIKDTSGCVCLILLFLFSGSLLSSFSIYLYLRFSKAKLNKKKINCWFSALTQKWSFVQKQKTRSAQNSYWASEASRSTPRVGQWQALIGTNGIESKADLARYLGVSRARVTHVLQRLVKHQHYIVETDNLNKN